MQQIPSITTDCGMLQIRRSSPTAYKSSAQGTKVLKPWCKKLQLAILLKVSVSQSYVIQKLYRTISSFRQTIARSRVMKIRTGAIQRRTKSWPNTMAKLVQKRGREQRRVNGYTLRCLREQAKWPTGAPIRLPLEFCIFVKRLFYEKLILNQVIAVLR